MITFKPKYSPMVNLRTGDFFDFQVCGRDENNDEIMYNNCGEVVEESGKVKICWNGARYEPAQFLDCEPWGGSTYISHLRICGNFHE